MNKKKFIYDSSEQIERPSMFQHGHVIIKDSETHETLYESDNKVTVAGSAFTAAKHWNIKPAVLTPTYNEVLGLENSYKEPFDGDGIRKEESI